MISALLSVYAGDNSRYLDACLASIWDWQERRPDEIVIVQDGPVPLPLREILAKWRDRLGPAVARILVHDENRGLGESLRTGLRHCEGDLVARIDADDLALPSRLLLQERFLTGHPEVDILGGAARLIDEEGRFLGVRRMPVDHQEIRQRIWSCPLIHPSVMFRKQAIISVGSYDGQLARRQEDYELWIRAARSRLVFHNLPDELIAYRVPENAGRKNGIDVGWNRILIGWSAVREFDPRPYAYVALAYPLIRALLPGFLSRVLQKRVAGLDPRS